MEHDPSERPPLGIIPQVIWKEHRLRDLIEAVARYTVARIPAKPEWYEEIRDLLNDHDLDNYIEAGKK